MEVLGQTKFYVEITQLVHKFYMLPKDLKIKKKLDWQGCQSLSASGTVLDWMTFLVTTSLTLPGQVWKIDDVSK